MKDSAEEQLFHKKRWRGQGSFITHGEPNCWASATGSTCRWPSQQIQPRVYTGSKEEDIISWLDKF